MFDGAVNEKSGETGFVSAGAGSVPPLAAAASTGGEYLVPAQMVASDPMSAPPRSAAKKKDRHHPANNNFMDDYFKEQEKKEPRVGQCSFWQRVTGTTATQGWVVLQKLQLLYKKQPNR
ncbi:hypothetical protein J3459_003953 [Metarhizium acridum]|nr:hypothetical protein J3459_003953 [Metarhizium acridum]